MQVYSKVLVGKLWTIGLRNGPGQRNESTFGAYIYLNLY